MKRDTISIHGNTVAISGGNVRMTDYEIAGLLDVSLPAVNSRIRSIYKSGALKESDTYQCIRLENGNRADAYNMAMITALAFQLNSRPANTFREWIIRKAVTSEHSRQAVVIQVGNGFLC